MILLPSGQNIPLKIHSMVGLVPLFAVFVALRRSGRLDWMLQERAKWFLANRPDLLKNVAPVMARRAEWNANPGHLVADRLTAVLRRMLDPEEFLSDYGVRSLSRYHLEHPYRV